MGRYKGKREASRIEGADSRRIAGSSKPPIGDPFTGDSGGKDKPSFSVRMHHFWDSGKGKILLVFAVCIAILGSAVGVAVSMWIKPPTPPSAETVRQPSGVDKISTTPSQQNEPAEPLDDELYPDDGYGGDMPAVSGDRKEGIYTFLLVGTDMDDGNTDTIMVVSYDTAQQDIAIMSIPRDTMINESWDIKKINSVYSRYTDGIGALKKRIKTLVGFTPDFYVKVDLSMFVELVDLIGGVEFDVPQDMNYDDPYQDLHIHLKKGVQVLDGEKAMELVRFRRYSEGDIKRVEVQQNFIKALIKECLSLKHWGKIKAYINLAMEHVQTDLEAGSVVWFAANVLGLNSGVSALNMDDVYTCTIPGDYWGSAWSRSTHEEQSYVTIYPKEVVKLVNERFNPFEQNVTTSMLDAMSILSNGSIASSTGSLRDTTHNSVVAEMRGGGSSSKNNNDSKTTQKEDEDSKDNPPDTDPDLPGTTLSEPNSSHTTNPGSNNQTGQNNEPSSPAASDPKTDTPSTQTDKTGSSNPPEPELPADTGVLPVVPEPVPEPEPVPVPEPAPEPEPVIDTDIPEWLLT